MPFPFQNHPARLQAVAAGVGRFDTGQPCAKGHEGPRYCSTGQCVQCCGGPLRPRAKKPKKPRVRTFAENQRRAELEAGRRRELLGGEKRMRLGWIGLGQAMTREDALARSKHLDFLIRKATGG